MPTVPTTFVPQVAPQQSGDIGAYAAPGVQPAENLTGQQVAQYGQALTQAGMAAFRLGSSIQDGIDDARTKDADIKASRDMQAISNEYSAMIGVDAQNNYALMQDKLDQASQSAMDSLENDVQRRMLAPILSRNKGLFQSRMWQHHAEQVRVYGTNAALGRAEQQRDLAIEAYAIRNMDGGPGLLPHKAYMGSALQETRRAGELMGYAPDSPQMQLLEQKLYDGIAVGVVNNLMLTKEYADAATFLEERASVEQISSKTRHALMESVVANRTRSTISELAESIETFGVLSSKSDPAYPVIGTQEFHDKYGSVVNAKIPETLRQALDIADDIEDREMRKNVQNELRTRYAQNAALANQEYNDLLNRVDQVLALPDKSTSDIPANVWGAIQPTDQQKFLQAERRGFDFVVQEQLLKNPALVFDDKWLEDNRFKMTPQQVVNVLEQRRNAQQVEAATIDADQLTATLATAGLQSLANPNSKDTDEVRRAAMFRNEFKTRIEAEQRQPERGGRKLNREEKQAIIDSLILDKVKLDFWFFDPQEVVSTLTAEELEKAYVVVGKKAVYLKDIPKNAYDRIRDNLENPTAFAIVSRWIEEGRPQE